MFLCRAPAPRPRRTVAGRSHWLLATLLAGAGGLGYGLYTDALVVPDRFNPWAPLDVHAPPDLLTGFKLSRARANPALCAAALATTGMAYDPLPDRSTGAGCGFSHAVRLREAGVRIGAPLALSCPMALSFYMWERNTLQPAAQTHFGQRVASLQHLGSYACRDINRGEGAATGKSTTGDMRSRHATADALDVAGFTLAGGKRISVQRDWGRTGPEAALLAEVHKGACRTFTGVLGPAYNAVHSDHFHLETGGYGMCR